MSVDVVGRWEDESVAAAPPIDAARAELFAMLKTAFETPPL